MGKMSEIDAEAREVLDICERLVSEKAKRGISQEEAERLERLWRDESFMGPEVTSKTSMGHLRTERFSLNKEPKK